MHRISPGWPHLPLLLGLLLVLPAAARAQQADFLFDRPKITLSLYGGWAMPGEGSGLFMDNREFLTVSRGDFASPLILFEGAVRATERIDLAVGLEYASASVRSEDREFVTADDEPIVQTTEFSRTRLLGSLKWYLLPRGRQVSRFSWIPSQWSPYVGAGGGVTFFDYLQAGDLVDRVRGPDADGFWNIFEARIGDEGHGWTAHALAGVQYSLTPRFLLKGEYRYIWGDAQLDPLTFRGYDDLDLSGSRALVGVAVRL